MSFSLPVPAHRTGIINESEISGKYMPQTFQVDPLLSSSVVGPGDHEASSEKDQISHPHSLLTAMPLS